MLTKDSVILIADDDALGTLLMQQVFSNAGLVQPLRFVSDGEEAIAYLRGDAPYSDRTQFPLPAVILLDLNMPRKNGFEVLAWIRQQPALKRIHVYVLSASGQIEDIQRAYELDAKSYLVKPGNLEGMMQQAKTLMAWFNLSHFADLT